VSRLHKGEFAAVLLAMAIGILLILLIVPVVLFVLANAHVSPHVAAPSSGWSGYSPGP
jgi:hypothetical protein